MSDRTYSHTPNNGDHAVDHPTEWLPGYALGCLSEDEMLVVRLHIVDCEGCREEVTAFLATVDFLPFSVPSPEPPAHIKHQLFARITANRAADQFAASTPRTNPIVAPQRFATQSRWLGGLLALCVVALVALGAFSVRREQELTALREQVSAQDTQMISFVTAKDAVSYTLLPTSGAMDAVVVMRPGHRHAALIIHGMPALEAGKRYQFWFASGDTPVPAEVFTPAADGSVVVMVEAPKPIEQYGEMMVTVEDADGSTTPSTDVVASVSM